jgi:hypothetical protein
VIKPSLADQDEANSWPCKVSDFEDYLLTGHRLSMGFAGSAVISSAAQ